MYDSKVKDENVVFGHLLLHVIFFYCISERRCVWDAITALRNSKEETSLLPNPFSLNYVKLDSNKKESTDDNIWLDDICTDKVALLKYHVFYLKVHTTFSQKWRQKKCK